MSELADIYNEKQAEAIQQMPLKQWKNIAENRVFLLENKGEFALKEIAEVDEQKEEDAFLLQKMSLQNLKKLKTTERILVTPTLVEKANLTGLSEETIEKLETEKGKATLEEIMIYCKCLHIPFREFLPELFILSV